MKKSSADKEKKQVSSSSSDDDTSGTSSDDSDKQNDDDGIADEDKLRGSAKEDLRGSRRREAALTRRPVRGNGRGGNSIAGRNRGNNLDDLPNEPTPEERQRKREKVMRQGSEGLICFLFFSANFSRFFVVLIKLLKKKPEGVLVDDLGLELRVRCEKTAVRQLRHRCCCVVFLFAQRLKVTNFRPELLGYESMDEWILNQPPQVLYYNAEERKILPSRIDVLPDDDDDDDDE